MSDVEVPLGDPSDTVAIATGMRSHYCGVLRRENLGEKVSVCGWVAHRRDHGEHLAFVDVRDHTGLVQCVVDGSHSLRAEYVVRVQGTVRLRPEGTRNESLSTGEIELFDCDVEVLSAAEPPPFDIEGHVDVDESTRLRYRFVDLRSERMQKNIRLRASMNAAIRHSMDRQGFVEIETPLLWTPTPEGAREFAVPSRLQQGSFYVLPQSPQIAKQLSMVGGFDRYYQIARCMRDEDLRADRQFEFTQLDIEASFVTEHDVRGFVSEAILSATETITGTRPGAIPEMTWKEALDRYGSDKPDLRFFMELVNLSEALRETKFQAFQQPTVKAIRVPGGGELGRSRLDRLIDRAKSLGAKGLVWMRVNESADGNVELESPIAKFLSDAELVEIAKTTAASAGDLLLIVADEWRQVVNVLGQLRIDLGRPPVTEGPFQFCWIVDFPLFDGVDEQGRPQAAHHPFTMPHREDRERLSTDPLSVRAQSYDLVLNGWELGSGSIRIHDATVQREVFSVLGISDEEAEARFGFLLGAFRYGAPPHGGFAVGLDRLAALLAGEGNIREVIAFPKTQSGADLMTGAPKPLPERHLVELGLSLRKSSSVGPQGS